MRLQEKEVRLLKEKLMSMSSEAKLYLFGLRADDMKRGGDIDLLVVSKKLTKRDLRIAFFKQFGEQKMNILLDDGTFTNPFHKMILQQAVELS